jgi:hypothetical protein
MGGRGARRYFFPTIGVAGGERISPTCVISSAASANVELPYSVTFTFSEPVTGFALGDITVTNGTAGSFATVSPSVYTATITPTDPGTVTVQVAAGVCTDLSANANAASNALARTYIALQLSVTTSGAETLTLQKITPTGDDVTVDWGDGGSTSTITDGNTGITTHDYAGAGTYSVTISNPSIITYIDLRGTEIVINSSTFANCISLAALTLSGIGAGSVINSAHLASLPLTSLYMDITQIGTYSINSSHFASYALTILLLSFSQNGTYSINSSHFASYALTTLFIVFPYAGTYIINSSNFAAMSALANITLSMHGASATTTIAAADWDGFPACGTIRVEAALTQAEVDNILLGLYDGFATKTVNNGTIDLLGQSNAAPSGVLQAQCPPTTGYEAAYELTNDSCDVSSKHWASVTTA